jgi:CheY-like chemotaxis protein
MLTQPHSPTLQHPSPRRVLIVEDTEATRQRLAALLSGEGYQVDAAVDGLDALKRLSASHYDAILLDLLLPHVDGWQFRETTLRHPDLRTIPTVILTVAALRESDRYALRTPFVLRKPIEDATVLETLKRACQNQQIDSLRRAPLAPVQELFWSRRGEVACAAHAPAADSSRWQEERWSPVDGARTRVTYQCQHCPGSHGPISRKGQSTQH